MSDSVLCSALLSALVTGCFTANPTDINDEVTGTQTSSTGLPNPSDDTTTFEDTTFGPEPGSSSSTGSEDSSTGETTQVEPTGSTSTAAEDSGEASQTSSSGGPQGFPNGAECVDSLECQSGHCFLTNLGGICSECSGDDDCDYGCSPFGFSGSPDYARCNDGSLGSGCETDDACMGTLECNVVVHLPGIIDIAGCSECQTDADCPGPQLCNPTIELPGSRAFMSCVPPGVVESGNTCDVAGTGDQACVSGYCGQESALGLVSIGVCSECGDPALPNLGCPAGQTCADAVVPITTAEPITPRLCE